MHFTGQIFDLDSDITRLDKHFQRKIVNMNLPINFDICFGCSKEPSH